MKHVHEVCIIISLLGVALAAYQRDVCPHPCRCSNLYGVQSVYCNGTGITSVPRGIPNNTQLLDLSYNPLPYIRVGDIEPLPNLQYIVLNSNKYNERSIEPGALLNFPQLTSIDLNDNSYTSIPNILPARTTTLIMSYNNLTVLKTHSLVKVSALELLDLTSNRLQHIEECAFYPLTHVREVRLPFNNLTNKGVPVNVFSKNMELTQLELGYNKLTELLPSLPSSLQVIKYGANQIKTIQSYAFKSTPNLQVLEFLDGQVTTIEDNAFFGLNKMITLDFLSNKLSSTITKNTFNGLTGLQKLYIDVNNISNIEVGALHSFVSLQSLWLQNNQLTSLQPEVLEEKFIPRLSELYIDSNPWYCDCHLRWFRDKMDNATYVIQDTHLIKCAGPSKIAGKSWDELKPSDFVCP